MIILLFGVSQVGKSSVGKALAKRLNYKFKDLDQIIFDTYGSVENFQSLYPNRDNRYFK